MQQNFKENIRTTSSEAGARKMPSSQLQALACRGVHQGLMYRTERVEENKACEGLGDV